MAHVVTICMGHAEGFDPPKISPPASIKSIALFPPLSLLRPFPFLAVSGQVLNARGVGVGDRGVVGWGAMGPVVPQNLFRGADGSETTDPGDSVGRWTRRKDCNCGIGRYAQAECWRCVLFLNGVGAQETDRSLLAAPSGTNAVVGR